MSIATKLQAILAAKGDIKAAIEGKGVTVGNASLDQYANKIGEIPTPIEEAPENDVNFYDYDGTRIASYTIAEAKALTALPTPPTHEGLTFQEWNWTLADIQGYQRKYIDIGANYIATDGKCHFKVDIPEDGLNCSISIRQTASRSTTIEWGDGSENSIVTTTGDTQNPKTTHTYTQKGKYEIKMYKTNSTGKFSITDFDNVSYITEVNLNEEVSSVMLKGLIGKMTISKNLTSFTPFFAYSTIPNISIPRDANWVNSAANTYCLYVYSKVSFPYSISPHTSLTFYSPLGYDKLIIPKFSSTGNCENNTFCYTTSCSIISIPNNLQWTSLSTGMYFGGSLFSLRELDVEQGWIPNHNLNISSAANLLASTIVDFFNKLGDRSEESSTLTISLGTANLNKLTADEKAIATNKGYTLA